MRKAKAKDAFGGEKTWWSDRSNTGPAWGAVSRTGAMRVTAFTRLILWGVTPCGLVAANARTPLTWIGPHAGFRLYNAESLAIDHRCGPPTELETN